MRPNYTKVHFVSQNHINNLTMWSEQARQEKGNTITYDLSSYLQKGLSWFGLKIFNYID